ncbi:hypothetical protein LCGC14_0225530 [marine sediment metagenome]|uniref:Uncharacterized protein n=1 Tax=marine sediment metagenome TaxID=412755 RepID=A0A0F9UH37_9ZZZZ
MDFQHSNMPKNFDDFDEPSYDDFIERYTPIIENIKTILKTVDLNAVAELFETFRSLMKHIDISKEQLLEILEHFTQHGEQFKKEKIC